MLDNTITLALPNGGTPVNADYKRFEEYQNRSVYTGEAHTLVERDLIGFYRTMPTRSGKFLGVGKATAKHTRDISIPDSEGNSTKSPIIIEISVSIPVGAASADVNAAEDRVEALLGDRTLINRLFQTLEV